MANALSGQPKRARLWLALAWTLFLVLHPWSVAGQSHPATTLGPGARLRLLDADSVLHVGSLVTLSPDSLWLRPPHGRDESFSREDIKRLDTVTRTRRRWLAGAAIGAGAGLGVLAVQRLFKEACALSVDESCLHTRPSYILPDVRPAYILGGGVVVGAIIGALVRADEWSALPLPPPSVGVSLSADPTTSSFSFRARLAVR
jgi:hypothetical protein